MTLKSNVKKALKESHQKLVFTNIDVKYKADGYDFMLDGAVVGRLGYAFVSSKFAEFGASFGAYCVTAIEDVNVTSILKKLNLTYPNYFHSKHFFGFSSLHFLKNKFYKAGTVSFYENDNVEEKCNEIIDRVNKLYVPKIQHFIDGHLNLIDDILDTPENYGFPMAYALIACYVNDRKDMVADVIKKGKQRKLYDSSQNKIDEIIEKLDSLYSHAVSPL